MLRGIKEDNAGGFYGRDRRIINSYQRDFINGVQRNVTIHNMELKITILQWEFHWKS